MAGKRKHGNARKAAHSESHDAPRTNETDDRYPPLPKTPQSRSAPLLIVAAIVFVGWFAFLAYVALNR